MSFEMQIGISGQYTNLQFAIRVSQREKLRRCVKVPKLHRRCINGVYEIRHDVKSTRLPILRDYTRGCFATRARTRGRD
jgi:hypothetical protein